MRGSSQRFAFASPAFAPMFISGSKRMAPLAPPHSGQAAILRSKVPESCHARRTRMGLQFILLMNAFSSSRHSLISLIRGSGRRKLKQEVKHAETIVEKTETTNLTDHRPKAGVSKTRLQLKRVELDKPTSLSK